MGADYKLLEWLNLPIDGINDFATPFVFGAEMIAY